MHALTSDRAETHSPLSERFGRDTRYLQPQTQTQNSSQQYLGNPHNSYNNNDVYELPTQAPSPNIEQPPHHHHQNKTYHPTAPYNRSGSAITPLANSTQHTPLHDLSSSSYPFPPSPSTTSTPTSSAAIPIPIPTRTTPTSPLASNTIAGTSGSYSSTLTQRIMERRMQQARESQTALSSASAYGSSLPSGQIGDVGSLLNGLPSVAGGGNGGFGGGANTSSTRLSGTAQSNRSAPRVGLLKPKGYREANSGFGGGVTG